MKAAITSHWLSTMFIIAIMALSHNLTTYAADCDNPPTPQIITPIYPLCQTGGPIANDDVIEYEIEPGIPGVINYSSIIANDYHENGLPFSIVEEVIIVDINDYLSIEINFNEPYIYISIRGFLRKPPPVVHSLQS